MRGGRLSNQRAAVMGVLAVMALTITGCSPKPIGHIAISKSATGRLMAHVAVCHGDDLLRSVRLVAKDATPTETGEDGRLDYDERTRDLVDLDPRRFQSVDLGPVSALPDDTTFYLHSHSDSSDVARGPQVTSDQLERLPVGSVLGAPGTSEGETIPLRTYRADPCADRSATPSQGSAGST